jgi:hypothetical protein
MLLATETAVAEKPAEEEDDKSMTVTYANPNPAVSGSGGLVSCGAAL